MAFSASSPSAQTVINAPLLTPSDITPIIDFKLTSLSAILTVKLQLYLLASATKFVAGLA